MIKSKFLCFLRIAVSFNYYRAVYLLIVKFINFGYLFPFRALNNFFPKISFSFSATGWKEITKYAVLRLAGKRSDENFSVLWNHVLEGKWSSWQNLLYRVYYEISWLHQEFSNFLFLLLKYARSSLWHLYFQVLITTCLQWWQLFQVLTWIKTT